MRDGHEVIGIANGWAGLVGDFEGELLTAKDLRGIIGQGGTLLGTARYDLDDPLGGRECVLDAIEEHVDALIAIGGDGTQRISHWLAERNAPVIGVPKTLDNDLPGTDYCIGFDTAISIVAESLDRLNTTAASHHRVIVVETMGRATGWVAALGGLAGGADMIVIPEFPDHHGRDRSTTSNTVAAPDWSFLSWSSPRASTSPNSVVTNSAALSDGVGGVRHAARGVGHFVAAKIEKHGFEVRTTVLGHLQRGGSPTAYDRINATRVAAAAYEAVIAGKFGMIPVVRDGTVVLTELSTVAVGQRQVPREIYDLCAVFF